MTSPHVSNEMVSGEAVQRLKGVQDRLIHLTIGKCDCGTKSPNIDMHEYHCTYRLAMEALDGLDVVKDALTAALSAMHGTQWMPIETAPKDGTLIWLGNAKDVVVGRWQAGNGWVCAWHVGSYGDKPTHWQPLPTPPTTAQE